MDKSTFQVAHYDFGRDVGQITYVINRAWRETIKRFAEEGAQVVHGVDRFIFEEVFRLQLISELQYQQSYEDDRYALLRLRLQMAAGNYWQLSLAHIPGREEKYFIPVTPLEQMNHWNSHGHRVHVRLAHYMSED